MTAVISACGKYRYTLERQWNTLLSSAARFVLWVMLNPSRANATDDDATIRRCIGFSKAWGYDGLLVGNLYALRSPYPRALKHAADPVGPDNDRHLAALAERASLIVCAWGQRGPLLDRATRVRGLLGRPLHYLVLTKDGEPGHPLRLRASLRPMVWRA